MATERTRVLFALVSVVVVASGVYLNSLGNEFALDDEAVILDNPQVHGIQQLPEAVSGPYWPDAGARGLYRPLTLGTYAIDWELGGGDPFIFHLVNVLLHAAVSALVLFLLSGVGASLPAAWAGALVFAIHPVHVEAVANIVGRAEILTTLFFLSASLVYLNGRGGWRTGLGVAGLYFLSLVSKENGVTLPAVLIMLQGLEARDLGLARDRVVERWPVWVAMAGALGAYFVLRQVNIGTFLGVETPPWFWGMPEHVRVLTAIRVWPEFLRLMVVPFDLIPEYGPGVIIPQTSLFQPLVLLGLLVGMVVALVAWRARRSAPFLTGGIAWFVLTVVPVAGILFPVGVILAERTLYLPSIGVALAVVPAAQWVQARPHFRRPAFAAFLTVLVLGGVRTWTANPVWRDSMSLMNYLLDEHPASFRAQWGLGNHFLSQGDTAAALDHLKLATRMVPGQVGLRGQYGELLLHTGQVALAAAQFDTALQAVPESETARTYLVISLLRLDRPDSAANVAVQGLRLHPDLGPLYHLYSQALARTGAFSAAASARRRALANYDESPKWAQWANLAALELLSGDSVAARTALHRAAELAPEETSIPPFEELGQYTRPPNRPSIPLW